MKLYQTPFSANHHPSYPTWRDNKLASYPAKASALITDLSISNKTETHPTTTQLKQLLQTTTKYNLAFYRLPQSNHASKPTVHQLATACGLRHLSHNLHADADSLTSIQVANRTGKQEYIPYTNRPLSWHTDGYYNPLDQQIHGMLMHCVKPAAEGGENWFMDHEIAYILLREADPAYIDALMHPEALTIPANIQHGKVIRPAQSGPVFSITANGHLHMRYSARQRNVQWRDDVMILKAERFLLDLWERDSIYKLRYTLQAGEGVICNNVLHCRTGFTDQAGQERLLYRGRYLDRISPHNKTDDTLIN